MQGEPASVDIEHSKPFPIRQNICKVATNMFNCCLIDYKSKRDMKNKIRKIYIYITLPLTTTLKFIQLKCVLTPICLR